jgi:predicted Fe-Mo cluster-binding NifX family protein
MKIAAATDDGTRLSAHFGRAAAYLVVTTAGDRIVAQELREKPTQHRRHGPRHGHVSRHADAHDDGPGRDAGEGRAGRHAAMAEPIRDCRVVLARGMGRHAHDALVEAGLQPLLVAEERIADAVRAYLDGTLEPHPERLP